MSRRELREYIFKMLFRIEFHKQDEMEEQMDLFFGEMEIENDDDKSYIHEKFQDIETHLQEIDQAINESTDGWKTTRMGKVDLTLIRLGVYEIKYETDMPTGVAINEAVELSKKYGTIDSPSFVNGVLAKFA